MQGKSVGKKHRSTRSSGGMKRSRSFLSMDNLDIEEENEEDEQSDEPVDLDDSSDASKKSVRNSAKPAKERGNESDDSAIKRAKALKTDRTAGQRKESPLLPPKDEDKAATSKASGAQKPLTLEEEIQRKLDAVKINQAYINDWEYGKENEVKGGTAQNGEL
jgi:hypothetical protein